MSKENKKRAASTTLRVGIDTGGTFTDCVAIDQGEILVLKVPSSPANIAEAAIHGLSGLLENFELAKLEILHGTTVGTNALLERKGARVALVTTSGFEDLIEIGRQNRPHLYDLNVRREPALVPRGLRLPLQERILPDGSVLIPLNNSGLRRLNDQLRRSKAEAVAVCLLFSYANPLHERKVAAMLRRAGWSVSVSHELLPEFREFERLSTTVINASLAPKMGHYLRQFELAARRQFRSAHTRLHVMQSSGGIMTSRQAAREPVRTILSGPAGGVVAAEWLAGQMGLRHVISFDMGGTSTDVCLINRNATITKETKIGGLPVAVPVLDVHSVGAGGGSIARFDSGGALRVGPQSAGAAPGPICYGRGGTQPTVTDAHVCLGRLDKDAFLAGDFQLKIIDAERRFDEIVSEQNTTWQTRTELAESILRVCNATMEKALRVISVERGFDPRDYSLICYGGAGGLHAAELARSLNFQRVIVPKHPGTFSALGVLLADIVSDRSQSLLLSCPRETDPGYKSIRQRLDKSFAEIERRSRRALERDGFDATRASCARSLGVRYAGQSFEISIPDSRRFPRKFHAAHEQAYGYSDPQRDLEIVNIRVRLTIPTPKPKLRRTAIQHRVSAKHAGCVVRYAWFEGRRLRTGFYDRVRLAAGMSFSGPAVVKEYSATTVIPPGFICHVDELLNLVITDSRGV